MKLKLISVVLLAVIIAFFWGVAPTVAQDCIPDSNTGCGESGIFINSCMDDLFPGDLNCTANDVRVSGVADVTGDSIVDENDITFAPICDAGATNAGADCSMDASICNVEGVPAPALCGDRCAFAGDTTSFGATFIVELNAQDRYDIGLFFAADGDPNGDGALTGDCWVGTLPEEGMFNRPGGTTGNFIDLDMNCKGGGCPQPADLCGDINDGSNPIYYKAFVTTVCTDTDGDGLLNLPSCTSWRQSGANELCDDPTDAYPGAPSKCNCDPAFQVPILIPADLDVVKTATPVSVNEPGDTVTFSITVTNTAAGDNTVTLNSLVDDIYGDITRITGDIRSTTCEVTIPGEKEIIITGEGGKYTCSFTATVSGNAGDTETDTVTASGEDERGIPVFGSDDATVTILDVLPVISVAKTANPTAVAEPGDNVTFTVVVSNDSPADPLTLTSLVDNIHGDLDGHGTCSVPQTIPVGGSYTCTFTALVEGQSFTFETDTVEAIGQDDEGNVVNDTDSATVNITDDVAAIELIKTANPTSVDEPGDDVVYTFTVNNLSNVDTVTINSLTDVIYGDLNGNGDCSVPQVLAPSGSYSCSITGKVEGDAYGAVTNVATATGVDDDGQPVQASDDATVNILNKPPAAHLTKNVTKMLVTYSVVVTNDSTAESLFIDSLIDDQFGDITTTNDVIKRTTCTDALDAEIVVGGSYSCEFDAVVGSSPHTDSVTAKVSDNEGGSVTPSDSAIVAFE